MKNIQILHDLVDTSDPQGRTYKEINAELNHHIPIGTLVEIDYDGNTEHIGVRLYVVWHARDCDQTPLYYLSANKNDTVKIRERFLNFSWIGGFSESSIKIIK